MITNTISKLWLCKDIHAKPIKSPKKSQKQFYLLFEFVVHTSEDTSQSWNKGHIHWKHVRKKFPNPNRIKLGQLKSLISTKKYDLRMCIECILFWRFPGQETVLSCISLNIGSLKTTMHILFCLSMRWKFVRNTIREMTPETWASPTLTQYINKTTSS